MNKELQTEKTINVSELTPHPRNNEFFDDMSGEKWDEFLKSIKTRGIIEPIIITQDKVIVSGHQRVRAAKELGIEKVKCHIRTYNNEDEILQDLLETNIRQRGSIGGSEKQMGRRIKELKRIYGIFHGNNQYNKRPNFGCPTAIQKLSKTLEMSKSTLNEYEQFADMIPELEEILKTKKITKSTALAMIKQLSPEEQMSLISSLDTTKKITQKEAQSHINEIKRLREEADNLKQETVTLKEEASLLKEETAALKEEAAILKQDQENLSLLLEKHPKLQDLIDTGEISRELLLSLYKDSPKEEVAAFLAAANANSKSEIKQLIDKVVAENDRLKNYYTQIYEKNKKLINENQEFKLKLGSKDMEIIELETKLEQHKKATEIMGMSNAEIEVSALAKSVQQLIETELAPLKFKQYINELADNSIAKRHLTKTIETLEGWITEIRSFL